MLRRAHALLLRAVLALLAVVLFTSAAPASAWTENHVLSDEVRIEVDREGRALVQHRLQLKTNGSVRFRKYVLRGIAANARPDENSYAIPLSDALSGSLKSAVPLELTVKARPVDDGPGADEPRADLLIKVREGKGLRRGRYLLVLNYRTDLRASGAIRRDGGRVRVDWLGPQFDDGFDNGVVTFAVPAAPTEPRAVERYGSSGDEATLAPTYLSEVRRGEQLDEVEIMRPFVPEDEAVPWAVRVDLRALAELLPVAQPVLAKGAPKLQNDDPLVPRKRWPALGLAFFCFYAALVWFKAAEVRRRAKEARAKVPQLLPLPLALRVIFAAALLVGGLALQFLFDHASWGSVCIVAAALLAGHGAAQIDAKAWMRSPGRWLSVSEQEALGQPARRSGAWLDIGSWRGKFLLTLMSGGVAVACWWFFKRSLGHALMAGLDSVALLSIFGTGRAAGLPPDLAVAPAGLLRKIVKRLRKDKSVGPLLRLTPRLRIPREEIDADELRLRVSPRLPLRGFGSIEIGVTYALGWEAHLAMPEVLVRVVAGSPCDRALASVSRRARITPGRKPDERVIALSPRLPTARMTAALVAAVAMRVVDRKAMKEAAASRSVSKPAKPRAERKRAAA